MRYKRMELTDGVSVQFVGVRAVRWQPEWGQPAAGFVEDDDPVRDAAHQLLEALLDARGAVESLPVGALGEVRRYECAPDGEGGVMAWPIRDELLDKISRAIAKARGEVT